MYFQLSSRTAERELVLGHVEIGTRYADGVEHAPALPLGRGRQAGQFRHRRSEIHVAGNGFRSRPGPEPARRPQHQRYVDVFLVQGLSLHPAVVRISEGLSMVAGDDDDGVVGETGAANGVEQTSEMTVRFVEDVEVPLQVVVVGRLFPEQAQSRDAGRRLIGMMRLGGPAHEKERLGWIALDRFDDRVDHAAVFDAPRRDRAARQAARVVQFVEASIGEERVPAGPLEIARRVEGGAIALRMKERRERGAGQAGRLLGRLAEVELRVDGEKHRRERVRAAADVRVGVVEHDAVR